MLTKWMVEINDNVPSWQFSVDGVTVYHDYRRSIRILAGYDEGVLFGYPCDLRRNLDTDDGSEWKLASYYKCASFSATKINEC
jgi:hypothetical protein